MKRFLIIFCMLLPFSACKRKFNRAAWDDKIDRDYPQRNDMVDDLINNHKLKGLSYKKLVARLGPPEESMEDSAKVYYQVLMDFGSDIDPVHTKYLVFKLNKDSIVTDLHLDEWKKN